MGPREAQAALGLLEATIAHAARAPYYRRRWGKRAPRVRTLAELARLPLLDKAQASRHQHQLIVGRRPTGVGLFSSGTTRGEAYVEPLHVPLTAEELRARADALPAEEGPDPFPGWTLAVAAVHHGLPHRLPAPDELMLPWLHDANALAMLETALRAPQADGRRVTALLIGAGPLKVLTAWLAQRGVDPAAFGVRLIGTYSDRLSPHWTALVEARFGAQVFDNYSLSEFGTPFTTCAACGWLHMGHPPVLWELLALDRDAPAGRRPGRLVFTSLVPYQQAMPLVRYDTGDVAVAGPLCRATGQRGLRVLGRLRHGVLLRGPDGPRFVLNALDVRDALEAHPEVARTPHPLVTLGVVHSPDVGPPRWAVRAARGVACLDVEVRFDPDVYPDRARALERAVLGALRRADPETSWAARHRKVLVRALPPGRVRPLTVRYD